MPLGSVYVGTTQELRYGQGASLITVVLNNRNFRAKDGRGYLPTLGYDRVQSADLLRSTLRSTLGQPYWRGPSFRAPEEFAWSLQSLSDAQLWAIQAILLRQQAELSPVRLLDRRLAYQEPAPQSRARIGSLLPGLPGMVCYWAQFDIELRRAGEIAFRRDGDHQIDLAAVELLPVPTTENLP